MSNKKQTPKKGKYKTLEVLGPEHEYSLVDSNLKALPIVDEVIRHLTGRKGNVAELTGFAFGKELQKHVGELKGLRPFQTPIEFEETMQRGILEITGVIDKFGAQLLGTGMHPTLRLEEARIWNHRDRKIYEAMDRIFDLRQHGWLNIQSFQINLPFANERDAVTLNNRVAEILPYLPAIAASSPIYESRFGDHVDNRLRFYELNQRRIPSIAGDVIPEYVDSFEAYTDLTVRRYSRDLRLAGAPGILLNKEWVNSRGAIFRFDRKAIEIRVMDEQECVKADVALSSFLRALIRGLMVSSEELLSHAMLVKDFHSVVRYGLEASVRHPASPRAKGVCLLLLRLAETNATDEEKKYLWIIRKRIEEGNLSEMIVKNIRARSARTSMSEAIVDVYLDLANHLVRNEVYT